MFGPGDFLRLRGNQRSKLQVLERIEQTCPGGTQTHYICRVHAIGAIEKVDFLSVEVEAWVEPEKEKLTTAALLDQARWQAVSEQDFPLAAAIRDLMRNPTPTIDVRTAKDLIKPEPTT